MNEKYPYQKQWEEYRRLKNRQYFVFIRGFTLNLISYLGGLIGLNSSVILTIQFVLMIVWIVALIYIVFRFYNWKCPSCGERFFRRTFWITMPELLSNCSNCNLPKYEGSSFKN